jgi:RNA polymerase sigma-70 factor (ECF subfamily)
MKKRGVTMENDLDTYLFEIGTQVMYFLQKNGATKHEAEDILQDSFYKILTLSEVLEAEEMKPWLYKVAINQFYDLKKTSKRRREILEQAAATDEPAVTNPGLEELGTEASERILEVIDQLKPDYRQILLLKYYENMSYEEISVILDISTGGVKKKLDRARQSARKLVPLALILLIAYPQLIETYLPILKGK